MGTSNANEGQGDRTPLVPSWLPPDLPSAPPPQEPSEAPPSPLPTPPADEPVDTRQDLDDMSAAPRAPIPPILTPMPEFGPADRYRTARTNFTRFAKSGGRDRASLGRALSGYVSTATGGRRSAAQRMGSSRVVGAQLLGFLSSAVANGAQQALRFLNLENLAGRPVDEIFIGLMDYVCPFDGGTVDEGIARDSFVETIADLAQNGISSLDGLTVDQLQTILELYISHTIENRICNDIGSQAVTVPADATEAASVQRQLFDFIRRSASDALTEARAAIEALTPANMATLTKQIYEQAFGILQKLAEAEADSE
jgi:hypothetical protein